MRRTRDWRKLERFCEAIESGARVRAACQLAEVAHGYVYELAGSDSDDGKRFSAMWREARERYDDGEDGRFRRRLEGKTA